MNPESLNVPARQVFGRILVDLRSAQEPACKPCSSEFLNEPVKARANFLPRRFKAGSFCGKCLTAGHWATFCKVGFHCRACFRLGHLALSCPSQAYPRKCWQPKPIVTPPSTDVSGSDLLSATDPPDSRPDCSASSSVHTLPLSPSPSRPLCDLPAATPASPATSTPPPSMANYVQPHALHSARNARAEWKASSCSLSGCSWC